MTDLVKVEIDVTKEAHELGLAVKKLVTDYKNAKKDGWDTAQDLPVMLLGSMQSLAQAFEGIEKVGKEAKEEPIKLSMAIAVPVLEAVDELLKKDEE